MWNPVKPLRLLAVVVLTASAALVQMAAPAGATTAGTGVASFLIRGRDLSTPVCATSPSFLFSGVLIAGATIDNGNPFVGSTGFSDAPLGAVTSDPLDGTQLGCGAGQSNVLADEGTVASLSGDGYFNCDGFSGIPSVPASSFMKCSLRGSFVRYGSTELVALSGCVKVGIGAPPGICNPSPATEDVAVVAQVVPLPFATDCQSLSVPPACSALAGPYVITPRGTVSPFQPALDTVYCPFGVHTGGWYPPATDCRDGGVASGPKPSDTCTSGTIVDGNDGGVYVKLKAQNDAATAGHTWVCFRVDNGGAVQKGGWVDVDPGGGVGTPTFNPPTSDADYGYCESPPAGFSANTVPGRHPVSDNTTGDPGNANYLRVVFDLYRGTNPSAVGEAWVCLYVTQGTSPTTGYRVVVNEQPAQVGPGGPPGVNFLPDPGTP